MSLELVLASRWSNPDSRRREAVRAAHEQDLEALLGLLDHHLTLKSARKADVSPDTRRSYALGVRRFLEHASGDETGVRLELARLEVDDVEAWLVTLQEWGLSPGSVAAYLGGARALYRALIWAKAVDGNPAAEARPPKDPTPAHARKGALTPADFRALLALPGRLREAGDPRRSRDELVLDLGGSGGLRAAELAALDVDDLELGRAQLVVRKGKGGKRRTVPLSRATVERAGRWLEMRRGLALRGHVLPTERALFVSVNNVSRGERLGTRGLREAANGYYRELGLPPSLFGLHTLRRTAGTHLYRATRDLHVVADVLGHASVDTTAIYAKMDSEVRREAVEAMQAMREGD